MKTKQVWLKSILTVFVLGPAVYAESGSGTASSTGSTSGATSSGGFFSNPSSIQDTSAQDNSSGRETKATDAANQGGTGEGAAIGAGSALTAAGVAQLLLGNYIQAATYFGMAGMEFGQAGADGSSQNSNQNQANTLTANAGGDGSNSNFNPSSVAQSLATPETTQALQQAGIDPNSFLNSLTSGNIQSGTSALTALGQNSANFSDEQLAGLNDPSTVDTAGMFGNPEALGNTASQSLDSDDSAPPNSGTTPLGTSGSIVMGAGGGAGAAGAVGGVSGGGGGGASPSASAGAHSSSSSMGAFPQASSDKPAVAAVAGVKPGARDLASLFPGVAGENDPELAGADPETRELMARAKLKDLGVGKIRKGQSIFNLAARNYRSFSKWRTVRVAKQ